MKFHTIELTDIFLINNVIIDIAKESGETVVFPFKTNVKICRVIPGRLWLWKANSVILTSYLLVCT